MTPPPCPGNIEFFDMETFAKLYVNETINAAIDTILKRKPTTENLLEETLFGRLVNESTEVLNAISSDSDESLAIRNDEVEWPNIGTFSKVDIIQNIKKFVDRWRMRFYWMYCVNFICEEHTKCSDIYFYDVKWSIPTKQYPIPQVTASIYFKIEVPRCKPKCSPIIVTYVYEGSNFVHRPLKIHFNEDWLLSILDNKSSFISTLRF